MRFFENLQQFCMQNPEAYIRFFVWKVVSFIYVVFFIEIFINTNCFLGKQCMELNNAEFTQ